MHEGCIHFKTGTATCITDIRRSQTLKFRSHRVASARLVQAQAHWPESRTANEGGNLTLAVVRR